MKIFATDAEAVEERTEQIFRTDLDRGTRLGGAVRLR